MRWGHYIALLAVACVVGLAGLAWLNRPSDQATKATVDDAVRSFRAGEDRGAPQRKHGQPALGVYRYETRGSESAQTAAVGGATHDYRGISTITLTAGRCGQRERWQVLTGRWSEGETCRLSHGKALTTATEFHEFFGVGKEDSFRCHGAAPRTTELRPGARFSISCESDDSAITGEMRVIGLEPVSVGGERFDAIHSMSRSRFEGASSGTSRRDEWRRRSDGLLLRRSADSEAETSGGGGTHYSEHYILQLLTAIPRR